MSYCSLLFIRQKKPILERRLEHNFSLFFQFYSLYFSYACFGGDALRGQICCKAQVCVIMYLHDTDLVLLGLE